MPMFRKSFEEAWSQALVSFNAAEQEAAKVVAKVSQVATFTADEARGLANTLTDILRAQRVELDRAVRDAVARATMQVPTKNDVEKLRERVDAIERRIEALAARKNPAANEPGSGRPDGPL